MRYKRAKEQESKRAREQERGQLDAKPKFRDKRLEKRDKGIDFRFTTSLRT